jgi:S-(hydroxymethyl)glutathione dehydrogenase/alcohol dehydrogenase
MDEKNTSRRNVLKTVAGGAVLATQALSTARAQNRPANANTAAQNVSPATRGQKFRAWVTLGATTNGPATTLQELTLKPITGRQVLVRTEAASLCYSNTGAVLGLRRQAPGGGAAPAPPPNSNAARLAAMHMIQGHGGVGIVEAVGPEVRRVRVGDRVCVSGTPQCGSCYQCLRGRSDMCQFLSRQGPDDLVAMAEMADGTPVYANSHIGGHAEKMVTFEEWIVPVFTKASAEELGMVCSCVSVAGLGATTSERIALVEPGSSVAVVGCGPLGLSAVQGARIAGASMIIAIDPIRVRRELALKVGATHVLDPNVDGAKVVDRVRELTSYPNDRLWAGGRNPGGGLSGAGVDFAIEAGGFDQAPPKMEKSPDPTGVAGIEWAYNMTAAGGHVVTTSLARGNVSFPATMFNIGGRTHHAGQAGGCSPMRDIPRFVALLDSGRYDAKSLATTVVPMEKMMEAFEEVVYRTTVTAILKPA